LPIYADLTPSEAVAVARKDAGSAEEESWESLDRTLRRHLLAFLQEREGDVAELRQALVEATDWARDEEKSPWRERWPYLLELLRDGERLPAVAADARVLGRPEGRAAELLAVLIECEQPMRPSELVEIMGLRTIQHLSNLSRGLVSAGLVVKQKTRGRATWLYPTPRALRLSPFLRRPRPKSGLQELKERIAEAGMPKAVLEKAEQELKRFEAMPPVSAETTVSRNYIDWLVSVPWHKSSRENRNLERVEKTLNSDHYGLEKIKERILEFLAARQLTRKAQSSIICFVGPPGVGKSSLAKSIARATDRKFVRLSLGGMRDEAEIRGHRRTYIGAFPGQIIQMMKKAGTVNPVFLLDEVDKMAADFRGDPAAALMEVLDPEQNDTFVDHYMDVEFDLTEVMFIATCNVLHTVPPALRDRMEVMKLSGYTPNEKLEIAQQFLVPRQMKNHGLKEKWIKIEDDAVRYLIDRYTREAGVRNLEREIASVCRKLARKVVAEGKENLEITVGDDDAIRELLGKPKFRRRRKQKKSMVGVSTGLVYTEVGGEILETQIGLMKGKGMLTLTGELADVMQEAARAAVSYVRSRSDVLGLDPEFNSKIDIHLHVPGGAIPKDGPSAGITMATALVSALTNVPVKARIAMTGEITLRGKVLPVGEIKDKILAAFRAEITEIVMPKDNEKDLEDIPEEILNLLTVHLVESMDEVLTIALDDDLVLVLDSGQEFDRVGPDPTVDSGSVAH
jgi:ATP-dependent Lon protease